MSAIISFRPGYLKTGPVCLFNPQVRRSTLLQSDFVSVGSEIFPMMGGKVNYTVIKCSPSLYLKSQQTLKFKTSAVSIHCVP